MSARNAMARCIAVALACCAAGCSQADVENPSGSCGTRTDGARAGYQAPSPDDVWVPDCQAPLLREYWRVFAPKGAPGGTGYVIPRPDGASQLRPVCDDAGHPLRAVVDRYGLCQVASSPAQVDEVNSMTIGDALHVTHFLHTQLVFAVDTSALGIAPFPVPSDIIDACDLASASPPSSDLELICQRERDRLASGFAIGFSYTGPGAAELVSRLNQLYGVPAP
jgi:hypothetical protein